MPQLRRCPSLSGFDALAVTSLCPPPSAAAAADCSLSAMGRTDRESGREPLAGCAKATDETSTSASIVWVQTTLWEPRARASDARADTVCASASPPPWLPPLEIAMVNAVDHWSRGHGRMSVNPAPSISALRVPREGFLQPRRGLRPVHLASEPASPPHARRTGCSPPKGQEPRGALGPASNVAPFLMMNPTARCSRKRNHNRPLRGRCAHGATSGAGSLTRPVAWRVGPSDSRTARDRGGSAAAHLQYIRAGKVRERELALLGLLPHHLDTPAPLLLLVDPVSVFVRGTRVCVHVCVCRALRPPRWVSTGPVAVRLAEMAN